mmetsp:Transcript_1909/g.3018  ORF Transcript_1909/g.3018 Transcript_1909/m.3018 type:complete len:94 (+) Transcript_1909:1113-1394(+)
MDGEDLTRRRHDTQARLPFHHPIDVLDEDTSVRKVTHQTTHQYYSAVITSRTKASYSETGDQNVGLDKCAGGCDLLVRIASNQLSNWYIITDQ